MDAKSLAETRLNLIPKENPDDITGTHHIWEELFMKVYKKIEYQTSYNRLEKIICDVCKAETTKEWKHHNTDEFKIEISMREGFIYRMVDGYDHDEGEGTKTQIDLCPDCFKSKLIPWIESQGGVPNRKEWEY